MYRVPLLTYVRGDTLSSGIQREIFVGKKSEPNRPTKLLLSRRFKKRKVVSSLLSSERSRLSFKPQALSYWALITDTSRWTKRERVGVQNDLFQLCLNWWLYVYILWLTEGSVQSPDLDIQRYFC